MCSLDKSNGEVSWAGSAIVAGPGAESCHPSEWVAMQLQSAYPLLPHPTLLDASVLDAGDKPRQGSGLQAQHHGCLGCEAHCRAAVTLRNGKGEARINVNNFARVSNSSPH